MLNATLMLLFLFSIKHFLADFVFQYDYMIEGKRTYFSKGGLHHSAIHGLLTAGLVMILTENIVATVIVAFLDAFIHHNIDYVKMNLSKHLTPADKPYWMFFGFDQLLHNMTYLGLTYLLLF
jgi:hypothetical protein